MILLRAVTLVANRLATRVTALYKKERFSSFHMIRMGSGEESEDLFPFGGFAQAEAGG